MEKQEEKQNSSSCNEKEDAVKVLYPLCKDCPYGKDHEICYPCWKYILGQEGYR